MGTVVGPVHGPKINGPVLGPKFWYGILVQSEMGSNFRSIISIPVPDGQVRSELVLHQKILSKKFRTEDQITIMKSRTTNRAFYLDQYFGPRTVPKINGPIFVCFRYWKLWFIRYESEIIPEIFNSKNFRKSTEV